MSSKAEVGETPGIDALADPPPLSPRKGERWVSGKGEMDRRLLVEDSESVLCSANSARLAVCARTNSVG